LHPAEESDFEMLQGVKTIAISEEERGICPHLSTFVEDE
jgi:hypothetical protein